MSTGKGWARFCGTQIEWNLLNRAVEDEVVPATREAGIGIVPYFPLASGMLTGKYKRDEEFPEGSRFDAMSFFAHVATDENFDRVDALAAIAEERGHTLLELAVAWLAAQDGVDIGDHRRDERRAGACERAGRGVAAHGRRSRGGRRGGVTA